MQSLSRQCQEDGQNRQLASEPSHLYSQFNPLTSWQSALIVLLLYPPGKAEGMTELWNPGKAEGMTELWNPGQARNTLEQTSHFYSGKVDPVKYKMAQSALTLEYIYIYRIGCACLRYSSFKVLAFLSNQKQSNRISRLLEGPASRNSFFLLFRPSPY